MPGPLGPRSHIGRLRHKCRIERDTGETRAVSGQRTPEWTQLVKRVYCEVRSASGREFFAASHIQAQVSHRVTMRYRRDLTELDRLVWLDNHAAVLNIIAVLPSVGEANMLDVWCLQEK